jgi:hypothetical protein
MKLLMPGADPMPASSADLVAAILDHAVLTALPGIATALYAIKRDIRNQPILLGLGLAGSGTAAMLGFWAFYAHSTVGRTFAFALPLASILVSVWALGRGARDKRLLRELSTPLLLWVLGSTFLVFLGFLYGGTDRPIALGQTRFSHLLPADNDLPFFFSEWFFKHGYREVAPRYPGGWQSSDRPPLQIGYVLEQRPLNWTDPALDYEIVGVLVQQLWIVALWALLVAAGVRRGTRALILIAVLVSDLTIVNGFFVWPKMLAAAFVVAASALVLTPVWADVRRSVVGAALLAALIGLSLLSHAASLFGVFPLMLWGAVHGLPRWKWTTVGLLTGALLIGPWTAYQRYGDPPGNRLLKWMLGGAGDVDRRPALRAIRTGYRRAGWQGTAHNKLENFATMAGREAVVFWGGDALKALRSGNVIKSIFDVRALSFFNLLPQLGLLLLGPFAMAVGYRRRTCYSADWSFAVTAVTMFLLGCLCWGLLMFGSEDTRAVIHTGSLGVIVLGICGAVAGLRATFPRLAIYVVVLRILFALVLYVPSYAATPDLTPFTQYSLFRAIAAGSCLTAFALVAFGARSFQRPVIERKAGTFTTASAPRRANPTG